MYLAERSVSRFAYIKGTAWRFSANSTFSPIRLEPPRTSFDTQERNCQQQTNKPQRYRDIKTMCVVPGHADVKPSCTSQQRREFIAPRLTKFTARRKQVQIYYQHYCLSMYDVQEKPLLELCVLHICFWTGSYKQVGVPAVLYKIPELLRKTYTTMKIPIMYSFSGIVRPQAQFPHSCVCEQFIYSQDRSTYLAAAQLTDRSWNYCI